MTPRLPITPLLSELVRRPDGRRTAEEDGAEETSRIASRVLSCCVAATGFLVLLGWTFDLAIFKSVLGGTVSMKPNVAVTLIPAALAAWLLGAKEQDRTTRYVLLACAAFVLLMGVVHLGQDIFDLDFGIDELLFSDKPDEVGTFRPGRPAIAASFNFILFGIALLLMRFRRATVTAQIMALFPAILAFRGLLGYLFEVPEFYGYGKYTDMAVPGIFAYTCLSAAILLARPRQGVMDTVMSPGAGGILMRRLAPPMIVLLLVFAWLRVLGEEKGLYDEQYGITLMILIATLTLGLAIYLSARHLTRVDQERMRMKKAAEDNAAEMLDLFNNAPCGYHSTDVDGVITRINDTELAWLGYRREEVVGRMKFSALLDQASRDDFGAVFNALKVRGAIEGFELVLKRADGSPLAALVNSQAVRDGLGSFMGSRDTVFDITSKKQTDRALRESNSQMRATLEKLQGVQSKMTEQARMRALGEMSSGIAHEINNTIAPILGFSETMLEWPETLDNREQTVEFLRIIHKAAADAAAVVSRLRKFHRRGEDTAKMRGRNVNEMVTDAIILTQPIWKNRAQVEGKTIQVTSNIMETRPLVCNDDEIREALVNLIMNSISAINRKGTITIAAEGTRDETVIRVNDDGAGMPENVRKHALEPFFTTKGTKGTGLGLSMVAGTVERHNGIIRIESTPGRGTAVTMRFRRRKEKAEDGPTNTPSLRWKDSLKILAVDDEPSIRRLLVEYLKKDGHHPEPAATGKEALDKFRKSNYDLVITDRAMPEMNGDELAKKIKKASPRTPIIMITGVHVSEKTHADLPAGVDRILGKPFSIKELRMAISSVMGPLPRESRARKANRKHKK